MTTYNYAHLEDSLNPSGAIDFMMDPDWEPQVEESGALYKPLGYGGYVKSSDGTMGVGGIITIVSTDDTMDAKILVLMKTVTTLQLRMPNSDTYNIFSDPRQIRKGAKPFSLQNTPTPINIWTFYYVEDIS